MAKCNRCDNTGKFNDDYCNCSEGRMQKTLDRAKRSAERKKAADERKKEAARREKQQQMELLEKEQEKEPKGIEINPPCKLFDWVEINQGENKGVIGVAVKFNMRDRQVFIEAVKHRKGHQVKGKSWFDWIEVAALPKSKDEDDLRALIDLAIDTKDEDWFRELTDQLP